MRAGGVLLPVFSLPGKYGIGCFSKEAYDFVDYLKEAGQQYWQILPLGPTSYGDSPYQSFSTFAGNPYFIDLDDLVRQGLLTVEECASVDFGKDDSHIDYGAQYNGRYTLLRKAYERSRIADKAEFMEFCKKNEFWLADYTLFMAIKDSLGGIACSDWPEDLRVHNESILKEFREKLHSEIEFYAYLQYEFSIEWTRLKDYANNQGIKIIGDIPIYVSADSSDLWANPTLFQLAPDRKPSAVAGCPPDGFSATGQLWGNPLYDWAENKRTGFEWWIRRIEMCSTRYDVIRIDHFRGFDEYFSIPAGDSSAVNGHWEMGPGMDLFNAIRERLGNIRIIAEDLGYVTDSVRQLVRDSGFPNMKVLEFAFDSRDSSGPTEYLPYNYNKNCVVYTGTHDNETIIQWLGSILPVETKMVEDYMGRSFDNKKDMAEAMIRLAQSSTADYCIIPMGDYLFLGEEARINKPSTTGKNWSWRVSKEQLSKEVRQMIYGYMKTYGRLPR